jgi:large subunit ribosomal protein L25
MKSVALNGNKRAERGTSNANNLRKEEKVPAVIYGGKENVHFTVNEVKFNKIINTPEVYFIDLDVDGAKFKAIIKDVQFHPVTDKVLHLDFLEVNDKKALTISIPVNLTGRSKGVANGGTLKNPIKMLKVSGLANVIPENIEIDTTDLKIGTSIKVGEINVEGLTFLDSANAVVVGVKMSRNVVADEDEEGAEGAEGAEEGAEAEAAAE